MGNLLLDQYSLLHFSVGVIFYFFKIPLMTWTILHILFEYTENTELGIKFINKYLFFWPGGKLGPDTFINNVGDVLSGFLGWTIAYSLDYIGNKYKWFPPHLIKKNM